MRNVFDAAVIGAGVFGAWTAFALRESGYRVALLDAHGAGNSRSSSGDETRLIRMCYGPDGIYTRMSRRSLAAWKRHFPEFFVKTGILFTADREDPYLNAAHTVLAGEGVKHQMLNTGELPGRFPPFRFGAGTLGLWEPGSGVLLARRSVAAVARASGAKFFDDRAEAPATGGRLGELRTVKGGVIRAGVYVFACGPWLPSLFPKLLRGRIRPTRQEVFYFGCPAGDSQYAPSSMPGWVDFSLGAYGTPDIEGRGIKIGLDRHGPPFDPEMGSRVISRAGSNEARALLAARFPGMRDAPLVESRVCQYENTSTGDFLIDRHPDFENVWLVGGGSGHGFKHGPAVADYVVSRIENRGEPEPRFGLTSKDRAARRAVY